MVAVGGILGALAASSCCIVPLVLFSLGIGGAWIGNLTALAPYKPLFVTGTDASSATATTSSTGSHSEPAPTAPPVHAPIPSRLVQIALWTATVLVAAAFAFDYVAPLLLSA